MKFGNLITVAACLLAAGLVLAGGCGKSDADKAQGPAAESSPPAAPQPVVPLVPKTQAADWCKEHSVPESACTRCNPALVAEFKKKGDWCEQHNLPKSQCIACRPGLEAQLKALAPKSLGRGTC